jgi:hypothetical protein
VPGPSKHEADGWIEQTSSFDKFGAR